MSGFRLETGGLVDRTRPLRFRFDGRSHTGLAGDTLTSALMAAGVDVVGRSFKYHRPRGVWGAWTDDSNAIFDIRLGAMTRPNCHGATTLLEDGMDLRAVNAWPSARHDLKGGLDGLSRFLPAGFYYKTFIWPDWHLFEPAIRRMAGLGRLDGDSASDFISARRHDACEVLVVGAGAAGLRTARLAAEAGHDTVLVDDHDQPGGGLHAQAVLIEGLPAADWIAQEIAALSAAGGRMMPATTANGIYDHRQVTLITRHSFARAPSLCRMRVGRLVLATGAVDRPVVFDNNDRPGVMSLQGASDYLARHAVMPGRRIAIIAPDAESAATRFRAAGAEVMIPDGDPASARAIGKRRVRAVEMSGKRFDCDTLLCSAGAVPQVQLWSQAGGSLDWDARSASFRPAAGPSFVTVVGAARGQTSVEACLDDAARAARGETPGPIAAGPAGLMPVASHGRQWVDFQNDVTAKDIALAARENYASVEHLKRYTTLGMGTDQGRSANVNGLMLLAAARGAPVPEVGTTRFRPPYVPVELEVYRGIRRGSLVRPPKRTALENEHRLLGAALGEYGGWLRAAWYGDDAATAIPAEARRARQAAGISDASPLGKIEVFGPDAAAFLDFVYYNTVSTLRDGSIRYGFMLTEHGTVLDDGVLTRLGADHFLVSCSSSHADGVTAHLESWRQDGHDSNRIHVHDVTQAWSTVTVSGPRARDIVGAVFPELDLGAAAFAHMSARTALFMDAPVRLARVSFTGDASYELSVRNRLAPALWRRLIAVGVPLGAGPLGMEAQAILRAEKGYVIVGKDTDGETMPHDLGFDAPMKRKKTPYVGDRGLQMAVAQDPDRRHLVGLAVETGQPRLPEGAHIVAQTAEGQRSDGFVTSSYDSATLGQPIALALLVNGRARINERVALYHNGTTLHARVVAPCAYDPDGGLLHA